MDLSPFFAALEIMVLERVPGGTFVRRGSLPRWALALRAPELQSRDPFSLEDAFPFLTSFLEQAESAWGSSSDTRVASDFWTEVGNDGEELHLEASAVQVRGHALLVVSQNERLFQQQQLVVQRARELRLVHDALMREVELKDILTHAIVHDLASPLHSILGALSLLEELKLGAPAQRWIQIALQAAMRQRQLVREILDVFSAEKAEGVEALDSADAPQIERVIAEVASEMEPVARVRGQKLELELHAAGCHVAGEQTRLFRVLTNLVDNALRSSPPESVVRITARQEGGGVFVTTEDQGPGVPVEVLPRLFEKFARGGPRGGTGLGLYFCRITLERWGGGIGYEQRAGGGARFWIRVPLARARSRGEANGQPVDRGR